MLKYVGHPLVDIGVATIAAFARKEDPSSLTEADLDRVADFIAREYVRDPLKSFLTVAFPNSGFTQPAFEKQPERRADYANRVLRGYRPGTPVTDDLCVFTGEPATGVAFSDKLPPGRAFRQHVPLIMGEGIINYFPGGLAGLPVSGKALLAIQAFPLGCAKAGGRLLAVHSDSPEIIYYFASHFLQDNQREMGLAQNSGSKKLPESRSSPKTMLVQLLRDLEMKRSDEAGPGRPASVTAYHLSNSGQSNPLDRRNPPLEIYHLPLELMAFLRSIASQEYRNQWNAISARSWRLSIPKKKKDGGEPQENYAGGDGRPRRNFLYEDLFRLPAIAPSFIRSYLLRIPTRTSFEDDPRRGYSVRDEASLVSWKLTELLLRTVLRMDDTRVSRIRDMGDRLADYISGQNDRRFFMAFYSEQRYSNFRNNLLKANLANVKRGNEPLITLDPYIDVFEEGDEVASSQWRLARDLVLIRLIERLHSNGWLASNQEAISDIPLTSDEPAS